MRYRVVMLGFAVCMVVSMAAASAPPVALAESYQGDVELSQYWVTSISSRLRTRDILKNC